VSGQVLKCEEIQIVLQLRISFVDTFIKRAVLRHTYYSLTVLR